MLVLLLILSILWLCISMNRAVYDEGKWNRYASFVIVSIACILTFSSVGLYMSAGVVRSLYIDKKIEMYQQENHKIEADISTIVKDYEQHETNIFANAKSNSPIVLAQLYPQLTSSTMVQQQITLYIANNTKIKELKETAIDYGVKRWWLYFDL